jgi:hypothetical protein
MNGASIAANLLLWMGSARTCVGVVSVSDTNSGYDIFMQDRRGGWYPIAYCCSYDAMAKKLKALSKLSDGRVYAKKRTEIYKINLEGEIYGEELRAKSH